MDLGYTRHRVSVGIFATINSVIYVDVRILCMCSFVLADLHLPPF